MAQGLRRPCAFFCARNRVADTMGPSGSRAGRGDAKRVEGSQGRTERAKETKKSPVLGGRKSSKHRGDISEMRFMIEASNRGFGVAKPIGDNERYDVILDRGRRRIWRVQLRGSGFVHQKGFSVRTCWRTCGKPMAIHSETNRFSGGRLQRPPNPRPTNLVSDSSARLGRAVRHHALSVRNQARPPSAV